MHRDYRTRKWIATERDNKTKQHDGHAALPPVCEFGGGHRCRCPPSLRAGAGAGAPDAEEEEEDARLPPPAMTFYPTASIALGNVDFFPLGGSKDDDVVALDHDGSALLGCSTAPPFRAVRILPALEPHRPKGRISPMSLTAGDSLYIVEMHPFYTKPGCFEVLTQSPTGSVDDIPRQGGRSPCWYWRSLLPPPFAYACYHDCVTTCGPDRARDYGIAACAVVGSDSKLWMTAAGRTRSTRTGPGSAPGDRALPFHGRAKYVPEHGLWFGLGSSGWDNRVHCLCASDLAAAGACSVWKWYGMEPPSDQWSPAQESCLVPLGSGKFCVARFFEEDLEVFQRRLQLPQLRRVHRRGGGQQGGWQIWPTHAQTPIQTLHLPRQRFS
ncbi:uncharacterized protein LOC133910828 [Phragmites australis]|uniref:uncharacterized protein LOC133910828 n=1 Tax=Phragmites australis TaxID=29695 RepID=UPI002D79EABA|nr:uncharacterized protein LOC133910828 [Phragmites australis]